MFNVCPGCGEYRPDREIRAQQGVAVCRCGHVQPFRPGPLFIVGGASGTGKSTVLNRLGDRELPVAPLDGDILWREEFRSQVGEWAEVWLRMAKNVAMAGKPVLLFAAGLVVPSNIEPCVERRYFSEIHRLALVCDEDALRERLRSRPAWRRSSRPEALTEQVEFDRWLRDNAETESITLVDTTAISVEEATEQVTSWIGDRFIPSK